MIDEGLRQELVAMRAEDLRVRAELVASGELGGPYVPRMEAVHRKNVARLRELIAQHGWPAADIAGDDGAEAAWLIAQHAIGEPEFQRDVLRRLLDCAAEGRVPRWHAAYLEDRIALHEGRPQRFGSQWIDDPIDGRARPWQIADPARVDELRAGVGLGPLPTVPERGPELPPDERQRREADHQWWLEWLASRGWSPT
jgi:hypothetical protein